jgi:uncharacterized protein (DUF58 family)
MAGGSLDFRGNVPFMENPDPRRIDLRASFRGVPRMLMTKAYHERGEVDVVAVIDFSASMGFAGVGRKLDLVAELTASIAWSAIRQGDRFSLIVCDDEIRHDLGVSPSHRPELAYDVYTKIRTATVKPKTGAQALTQAVTSIRRKRSLVFLISDFHLDDKHTESVLRSMALHDVVPVVMWDKAEFEDLPTWGWARVMDLEDQATRSLFMRKSMASKIQQAYELRKKHLARACREAGFRAPFFMSDSFNAEQLSRHLLEGM